MIDCKNKNKIQLPSFFVVGAQKAGTTSLHHWLLKQSGVFLPKNKETHFFSSNEQYSKGLSWYLKQFPDYNGKGILGEVAPDYMFSKKAPERIHKLVPSAKLIFIFREPIQRAFSHYLMSVRNGYEPLSFCDALKKESQRVQKGGEFRARYSYMSRSMYGEQISEYKQYFPDASLMFIKFDDLITANERSRKILNQVGDFIDLEFSDDTISESIEKGNPASIPYSLLLRDFLYNSSKLKKLSRILIPSKDARAMIAHKLDLLNQNIVKKPSISNIPVETARLAIAEIKKTQNLTGLDSKDWMECASKYQTI